MKRLWSAPVASCLVVAAAVLSGCAQPVSYDVVLRNGIICDGSGSPSYIGDVAITGDRIAAVGTLAEGAEIGVV